MNMVIGHILRKESFTPQVQETIFNEDVIRVNSLSREYEFEVPLDEYMEEIEKNIIIKALLKYENNISEAARNLNIKRQTLQHKMKKYNIQI
jgi:arginine utilization regulatory protein